MTHIRSILFCADAISPLLEHFKGCSFENETFFFPERILIKVPKINFAIFILFTNFTLKIKNVMPMN